MESIGMRLKRLREEHLQMNQRTFSEKIGISQPALAMFEKGDRDLKEIHIKRICDEFSVNKDWLVTGSGGDENMFIPDDMKYFYNVGKLSTEQNEFKKFYLNMMMNLPDDYWNYIYNEFKKFENSNKNSGE